MALPTALLRFVVFALAAGLSAMVLGAPPWGAYIAILVVMFGYHKEGK